MAGFGPAEYRITSLPQAVAVLYEYGTSTSTVLYSIASIVEHLDRPGQGAFVSWYFYKIWKEQKQQGEGAFVSWSCAHLMDRALPDLHPSGWAYTPYSTTRTSRV